MIRFIDLSNQIIEGEKEFAFYNTVTGKFFEFSDSQTWDCIEDFITDFTGDDLNRFILLIPENWGVY